MTRSAGSSPPEGRGGVADPVDAGSLPDSDAAGIPAAFPQIDFSTFVLSLSQTAYVHMGDAPDPGDGLQQSSLPLARQTIDILALLEEKTRGNLTGEEERVLEQVLYDLRLRYVEIARRVG